MRYGYKLMAEAFGPAELVRQARLAEEAGFDFVEISDHYHPWLERQGHSPFAWSVLGSIAAVTERIGLATGVTCPTVRYHPAIIAQAAATLAILSEGRFTLGIGAGERLNEHVVGLGFPSTRDRHRMLREALEIIALLWQGGYHSYDGEYLNLEDARVFDLPDELPAIAVAASGEASATLAAERGSGLFAVEPNAEIIRHFEDAGGKGPRYGEVSIAWGPDADAALDHAWRMNGWSMTGWKVMSELPNPVNFEAVSRIVHREDVAAKIPAGPDAASHVDAVAPYAEAGFDHVALMNAGPDVDGFFGFFADELRPALDRRIAS